MSNRLWRNSASLILAVRNSHRAVTSSRFDYNLLMLKRSSKSKFMPSAYVFPGGVTEKSDFSPSWKDLLESVKSLDVFPLVLENVPRPMILRTETGLLEADIGFRINAIRETFEETGILLHLPTGGKVESEDLVRWRPIIHKDASQFLTMCRQLSIVPDIWSLYEWSDWLTPLKLKEPSRFDTIFYVGFSEGLPHDEAVKDGVEVSKVIWSAPDQLLLENQAEKIWLAPPQIYELSRILNFVKFDEFRKFSIQRSRKGCRTCLPYKIDLSDGTVFIYPQDELYPDVPDLDGSNFEQFAKYETMTMLEFSSLCKRRNRMEQRSLYDRRLDVNVEDDFGHVTPSTSYLICKC